MAVSKRTLYKIISLYLIILFVFLSSCDQSNDQIAKHSDPVPELVKPKVLLISNSGTYSYNFTGLAKNGLIETGLFTSTDIDILENPGRISLSDIDQYDAILAWSNIPFEHPENIRVVLEEFVDGGGGLVYSTFLLFNGSAIVEKYSPFSPGENILVPGEIDLSTLPDPGHPIFNNITNNPRYWSNERYSDPLLNYGCDLLALDTQGNNVLAENPNGSIIFIEIFPGILNIENQSTNNECRLMFANSLYYVSN